MINFQHRNKLLDFFLVESWLEETGGSFDKRLKMDATFRSARITVAFKLTYLHLPIDYGIEETDVDSRRELECNLLLCRDASVLRVNGRPWD